MEESWPQVQVALDLVRLKEALRIARAAASQSVGWLEAGTPLIKSEGMKAVRVLSRTFHARKVVADMKTLDAGRIEAEMAFEAGAKVVSISGLAHDRTIRDSVQTAARHDGLLMADLLMSSNPRKRARQLQSLGVDIVCVHMGIDAQRALRSRLGVDRNVREMVSTLRIPVAVAGGVNPDSAEALVRSGVKLIIVGGWITGSKDPARASRQIVEGVKLPNTTHD